MQTTAELKPDLQTNLSKEEVQTLLAIKLYEMEHLSLGQAAKLAGYSKRAFIEILGRHKVPVLIILPMSYAWRWACERTGRQRPHLTVGVLAQAKQKNNHRTQTNFRQT